MKASERVSFPAILQKAAPMGRKAGGTRTAFSTTILPFLMITWSA